MNLRDFHAGMIGLAGCPNLEICPDPCGTIESVNRAEGRRRAKGKAGSMELNLFWAALWRRWYLTVFCITVAVALTALTVTKIGPTYEAEGTMLLFPPTSRTATNGQEQTQGNPYLQLGGLSQARDVVIRAFDAESAQEEFAAQEPTATYEMAPDYTTSGPLIIIDVSAPTPDIAISGLQKVMKMVPKTLKSLQTGLDLPESAYITAVKLTLDTKPKTVRSGQVRAGIVVAAVALTLAFFLIGLLDGLLTARAAPKSPSARSSRRRRRGADSEDAPETPHLGRHEQASTASQASPVPPSTHVPGTGSVGQHDAREVSTGSR